MSDLRQVMIATTPPHRLTQHKRFVPYGTHPNPSLSLRTYFMLATLDDISRGRGKKNE
jgi:hypothetical protein